MSSSIQVIDLWSGEKKGTVKAPSLLKDVRVHKDLLHRVVVWQGAKRRGGHHATKGRSDVSASKRKIYRQKGTGGARHAARSANIFRGGGVVFGPQPRSHAIGLPKRLRLQGLCAALKDKLDHGRLFHLDEAAQGPEQPRTKDMERALKSLDFNRVLVLGDASQTPRFRLALNNLPYCDVLPYSAANVYDILHHEVVVVDGRLWNLLEERMARLMKRRPTGEEVSA